MWPHWQREVAQQDATHCVLQETFLAVSAPHIVSFTALWLHGSVRLPSSMPRTVSCTKTDSRAGNQSRCNTWVSTNVIGNQSHPYLCWPLHGQGSCSAHIQAGITANRQTDSVLYLNVMYGIQSLCDNQSHPYLCWPLRSQSSCLDAGKRNPLGLIVCCI
jgi:hypothetical protein